MAIQTINLGSYANDGTGDDLRTAFEKVNANFTEMTSTVNIVNGTNLGSGTAVFAQKNSANLEFKTLTSVDNSVTITSNATTVNLKSTPNIVEDTTPQLGGNLDLNGFYVYGGDTHTTVWGYDVPTLAGIVQLILESNNAVDINMQSFTMPSSVSIDMNGTNNISFTDSAGNLTELNFGTFV